jgi:hypothetical protein
LDSYRDDVGRFHFLYHVGKHSRVLETREVVMMVNGFLWGFGLVCGVSGDD